jgi:hypothetical protein
MVGDYISTSIRPGDDDATPVFAVAEAPTGAATCSNLSTGAPGSRCNEAMFTTVGDLLPITGGTNAVETGPTYALAQQQALSRHTAN